ncbi:MAG: hypothetical protein WDA27_14260 [Actinomycetota bacterium]
MRLTRALALVPCIALALSGLGRAGAAPADCAGTRAPRWLPSIGAADDAGDVRVFAVQFKQDLRHVESYDTFRRKMECLVEEFVLPYLDLDGDGSKDKPAIVVFNEDDGLATIGTGSRGATARAIAQSPARDPQSITGAQAAFGTLGATYSPAIAYYAAREHETSAQRLILAAATDTFVRGFMQTYSDIARRYGIYVVSANNQAEFREVNLAEHPEAAALVDPDLKDEYLNGHLTTVYEAVDVDAIPETVGLGRAGIDVHNKAFMWAPDSGVTDYARDKYSVVNGGTLSAADPRSNLIHVVKKTPLTQIEIDILDLSDDEDLSSANTGPFCLTTTDDPDCSAKIGYGISLPTFMWGDTECSEGTPGCVAGKRALTFGEEPADGADPCAGPVWWMRCLDARGVNVLLQPEANPGPWGEFTTGRESRGFGDWQPLSWLDSAWRSVADPTVGFRYAVTPHMVGNLVDLTFDGQSVIFERCSAATGDANTCDGNQPAAFVGTDEFVPCVNADDPTCDAPLWGPYAGPKPEVMVLAPWVLEDDPSLDARANRARLSERARAMLANSGSVFENDYLETTVWADLDLDL